MPMRRGNRVSKDGFTLNELKCPRSDINRTISLAATGARCRCSETSLAHSATLGGTSLMALHKDSTAAWATRLVKSSIESTLTVLGGYLCWNSCIRRVSNSSSQICRSRNGAATGR
jgi:hypothetical protein